MSDLELGVTNTLQQASVQLAQDIQPQTTKAVHCFSPSPKECGFPAVNWDDNRPKAQFTFDNSELARRISGPHRGRRVMVGSAADMARFHTTRNPCANAFCATSTFVHGSNPKIVSSVLHQRGQISGTCLSVAGHREG